ncbi:YraN family protein [Pilimelia columellifera]|uniref:UPF0102 protein GCM10010201_07140 n=1 Tax=Pilimelia columellifera subsp. columellifera TaxID=706583 RepID=A0ABN3N3I5_9ACTN
MTQTTQALGRHGEQLAVDFLTAAGMAIIDRNWRRRAGEIDIIARDGDAIVFVEVKTRRGEGYGGPLAAVAPPKVARLRRLAGQWLASAGLSAAAIRIDVIGVLVRCGAPATFNHVRGVG